MCAVNTMKKRFVVSLMNWNLNETIEIRENFDWNIRDFKHAIEMRENVLNFDRETISNHDIDVFDVVNAEVIKTNRASIAIDVRNDETTEIDDVIDFKIVDVFVNFSSLRIFLNFFACFVRMCSCNLMLLKNLTRQRLQTNFLINIKLSWYFFNHSQLSDIFTCIS